MFMATLDPVTLKYPADDTREPVLRTRAYRLIHAPRGCSAYWDQPTLMALSKLSAHSGNLRYLQAAEAYLTFFMDNCVSQDGIFYWGNHYFYDAFQDKNVEFNGSFDAASIRTQLINPKEPAILHEMRPIVPDWELMYRIRPEAVERHIRTAGVLHLFDDNGGFNRHSDRKRSCAFLESGGILVYSLCFLFAKTGDRSQLESAMKIAEYSYSKRHPDTQLLVNNPTATRWDGKMATTECGFWARTLFLAAAQIAARQPEEARRLKDMAVGTLTSYLHYAYDPATSKYYGRMLVEGVPDPGERATLYQPDTYSNVWEFLFPSHDYPLSMAMAALELEEEENSLHTASDRWANIIIRDGINTEPDWPKYAENYGRMVVFLAEYAERRSSRTHRETAERLLATGIEQLSKGDMLVGHTGARWYDAIDGVGYLLLAALYLHSGDKDILRMF
jgi:hypothetical protein